MSPRLPSAITSRPRSRACSSAAARAAHPDAPSTSKRASWNLTATHASAVASITARQCRSTVAAAPQRILDGVDDGVDRASGIGLGQRGAICDLLDKLRLLHVVLLCLIGKLTLTPHADGELATMRAWA